MDGSAVNFAPAGKTRGQVFGAGRKLAPKVPIAPNSFVRTIGESPLSRALDKRDFIGRQRVKRVNQIIDLAFEARHIPSHVAR